MAKDVGFHDYVTNEVFRDQPGISSRHMFGGWGIYQDGIFFALITDGRLFFKVDGSNQTGFEKAGSEPFVYEARGKKMTLSYYELPADVIENPQEIGKWIEQSVRVAKRSKNKK